MKTRELLVATLICLIALPASAQQLCDSVSTLTPKNITLTGAIVSWHRPASGNYSGARLEWKKQSETIWQYIETSDTIAALSALEAGTPYDLRVAALCDNSTLSDYIYSFFYTRMYTCAYYDSTTVDTAATIPGNISGTVSSMPIKTSYPFSFSEQLITADEIGHPGTIHAVGFQYASSSSIRNLNHCAIFLAHTSLDSINDSLYIPLSSLTKVYEGPLDFDPGWNTIEFNISNFVYNGDSNLIVAVADDSDTSFLTAFSFMSHFKPNMAVAFCSYTIGSWNLAEMSRTYPTSHNNIRLHFGECDSYSPCYAPQAYVTLNTTDSIGVAWCSGADEMMWDLYLKEDSSEWEYITSTADNNYYFEWLQSGTPYSIRIMAQCDDSLYAEINAATLCQPLEIPFFEGFENWEISSSGATRPCWWRGSTYQTAFVHPPVTDWDSYSGTKCLSFDGSSATSTMIVLPKLEVSVDSLQVNFMMRRRNSTYTPTIIIGAVPDSLFAGTSPTINQLLPLFTPIDTVLDSNDEWTLYERPLSAYSGGPARIAFLSPVNASAGSLIDDILVDLIPSCPHPTGLTLDYATPDSIVVHWDNDTNIGWWVVSNGITTEIIDTNAFAFDWLDIQTDYTISVRSFCGINDTSTAISAVYSTLCDKISSLPYFTDFDSVSNPGYNSEEYEKCWQRYRNYTNNYDGYGIFVEDTSAILFNNNTTAFSGNQYLRLHIVSDLDQNGLSAWTVLPEIDTSAIATDTLMLRFYARVGQQGTAIHNLQIGFLTHPDSIQTFSPVDTVEIRRSSNNDNEYHLYEVPFNRYNGNGSYLALKADQTLWTYSFLIDDLELNYMPACPHITNLTATFVDNASVTFNWHEVGDATSWTVEHGPLGFSEGTGIVDTSYSTTFTVTGLTANTDYDFVVHPICSAASEGIRISQRTSQFYYSLPYHENFVDNAILANWNFISHRSGSGIGFTDPVINSWAVGNAIGNGDSSSLYITPDSGATYDYYYDRDAICFAWTDIMLPDSGNYAYSFDYRCDDGDVADYFRAVLIPASTDIVWNTSVTSMQNTLIDGGSNYSTPSSPDWTTHSGSILCSPTNTYFKPGVYHLVFYWRNDGAKYNGSSSYGGQPAAIDNIHFIKETCPAATAINILHVGADTMRVSWTPHSSMQGTISDWYVTLGNQTQAVTGPPYVAAFGGLLPQTEYTITVSPICSDGDTGLPFIAHQSTICAPMTIPVTFDFENITTSTTAQTGVFPPCWQYNIISTQSNPVAPQLYYDPATAHSGDYSMHLYHNSYVILPDIVPTLDSVKLSFWHKGNSITVGIMYETYFYTRQTVNASWNQWTKEVVTFPSVNSSLPIQAIQHGRICFRNQNGGYQSSENYLDDIAVSYLHPCNPVTNLHLVNATDNYATIDWDGDSAMAWVVEYGPVGYSVGFGTTDTVFSHPYTMPFPAGLSVFDLYVHPICDIDEVAGWTGPVPIAAPFCDNATEATTGTGNGNTYDYPLSMSYNYSFTETIITETELNGIGTITDMAFFFNNNNLVAPSSWDSVDIWLQPTTANAFGLILQAVDTNSAVMVYSGQLDLSNAGWMYLHFDQPYTYSGSGNLMLIVNNRANSATYSVSSFRSAPCTGNLSLGKYANDAPFDPFNPDRSATSKRSNSRVMLRLISCGLPCPEPTNAYISNIHANYADLYWSGNATAHQVIINEINTNAVILDTIIVDSANSSFHLHITGLTLGTDYQYSVRGVCGGTSLSEWLSAPFSTPVPPCERPTDLTVLDTSWDNATFDWIPNAGETQWFLHIWNTGVDTVYTVTSHPVTINNLGQSVSFFAAVAAYCQNYDNVSSYSDTVSFGTIPCPVVTGVHIVELTPTSATIAWNSTTGLYSAEYGNSYFDQGTGTLLQNITETTTTITGLEPETEYDFYVRSHCSPSVHSNWSNCLRFTTASLKATSPDSQVKVSISPNPAHSKTTVQIQGVNGTAILTLTDVSGRQITTERFNYSSVNSAHTLDLKGLTPGAYFLSLRTSDYTTVRKLIIK